MDKADLAEPLLHVFVYPASRKQTIKLDYRRLARAALRNKKDSATTDILGALTAARHRVQEALGIKPTETNEGVVEKAIEETKLYVALLLGMMHTPPPSATALKSEETVGDKPAGLQKKADGIEERKEEEDTEDKPAPAKPVEAVTAGDKEPSADEPKASPSAKKENGVPAKKEMKKDDEAVTAPSSSSASNTNSAAPLRFAFEYQWTDLLPDSTMYFRSRDVAFEIYSVVLCLGTVILQSSARLASSLNMLSQIDIGGSDKTAYAQLQTAAGLFNCLSNQFCSDLRESKTRSVDVTQADALLSALSKQSLACAQEITIKRAIEKKHSLALIAKLAMDTRNRFSDALLQVEPLQGSASVEKWVAYLQFKKQMSEALMWYYWAQHLGSQDDATGCTQAIAGLEHVTGLWAETSTLFKVYVNMAPKTREEGLSAHFERTSMMIERHLNKYKSENNIIYHESVPALDALPAPEGPKSLVEPGAFSLPEVDARWSPEIYNNINLEKLKAGAQDDWCSLL